MYEYDLFVCNVVKHLRQKPKKNQKLKVSQTRQGGLYLQRVVMLRG